VRGGGPGTGSAHSFFSAARASTGDAAATSTPARKDSMQGAQGGATRTDSFRSIADSSASDRRAASSSHHGGSFLNGIRRTGSLKRSDSQRKAVAMLHAHAAHATRQPWGTQRNAALVLLTATPADAPRDSLDASSQGAGTARVPAGSRTVRRQGSQSSTASAT
jgi:hypothetical protein